jgi:pyridoxine kinase
LNILSIQSWVASGHVGNATAIFPLQRLGAEVTAIHTVQFSNHPGHGAFTGQTFPPADIAALVTGLDAHGALDRCDGVLSGYIGNAAVGGVILDAVKRVRSHNPVALWCCDPVMGDNGRLYVQPAIPQFFANQAVQAADILTPNQFELDTLTGLPSRTWAQACAAAASLRSRMRDDGPRLVLVSSLVTDVTPDGSTDMLLLSGRGAFRLRAELLPAHFSGAGDTLAALFLYHVIVTKNPAEAATRAVRSLAGILRHTWQSGAAELQIVAAQSELIAPTAKIETEEEAVLF